MRNKRGYKLPLLHAALSAITPNEAIKETIKLGNAQVVIPQNILNQVTKLMEGGISAEDIVTTVAKGEWAYPLAKAFCLSEERFRLAEDMLTTKERACIDTISVRLAKELLGAG